MGWCGVGAVIRESIDLSEYQCEYASFTCVTLIIFSGGGGETCTPLR